MGCPQGPIRIAQEFAGDDDYVRLSGTDDVLSLNRRCDHSDCTGQNVGFPADLLGKRCLIPGTDRNLCMHDIAARRTIDQVYSKFLELAGEFDRLLNIPAAIHPIGCRNAYKKRCSLGPGSSNGDNDLAQYSSAILK